MPNEPTTWFHGDGSRTEVGDAVPIAQLGRLLRGVGAAILLAECRPYLEPQQRTYVRTTDGTETDISSTRGR